MHAPIRICQELTSRCGSPGHTIRLTDEKATTRIEACLTLVASSGGGSLATPCPGAYLEICSNTGVLYLRGLLCRISHMQSCGVGGADGGRI